MCGLGGYAGVGSEVLAWSLGAGLDTRGMHAAGFVTDKAWSTRVGPWIGAKRKFLRKAGAGNVGILHARFATCGSNTQSNAHPFEIRRNGRPVLYGAHNGIIDDAWRSAREHDRRLTVDSRELFELIADERFAQIRELHGYGVACWMRPGESEVRLVRLSDDGEMCVVKVKGGGYAWASTWTILKDALKDACLDAEESYELEVGVVHRINPKEIRQTTEKGCHLAKRQWSWNWRSGGWLTDDELDAIIEKDSDETLMVDPTADETITLGIQDDPEDADDPRPLWLKDHGFTNEEIDEAWEDRDEAELKRTFDKWMNVGRHGA